MSPLIPYCALNSRKRFHPLVCYKNGGKISKKLIPIYPIILLDHSTIPEKDSIRSTRSSQKWREDLKRNSYRCIHPSLTIQRSYSIIRLLGRRNIIKLADAHFKRSRESRRQRDRHHSSAGQNITGPSGPRATKCPRTKRFGDPAATAPTIPGILPPSAAHPYPEPVCQSLRLKSFEGDARTCLGADVQ